MRNTMRDPSAYILGGVLLYTILACTAVWLYFK